MDRAVKLVWFVGWLFFEEGKRLLAAELQLQVLGAALESNDLLVDRGLLT